jgi:hypothetical protein
MKKMNLGNFWDMNVRKNIILVGRLWEYKTS